MDHRQLQIIKEHQQSALHLIDLLNDGRRDWTTSTPYQMSDSDVIISDPLYEMDTLIAEVKRLQRVIADAKYALTVDDERTPYAETALGHLNTVETMTIYEYAAQDIADGK